MMWVEPGIARRGLLLAAASFGVALLLAACGGGDGDDPATARPAIGGGAGRFSEVRCDFDVPDGQTEGETVTCGFISVPEDYAQPDGVTIDLAVAIFHATGDDPQADPLIYLAGGPGGPAIDYDSSDFSADYAEPIQSKRDIVFFDQRGSGRSRPALECWEVDSYAGDLEDDASAADYDSAYDDALGECADRFRSRGVAIDAYTSETIARDIGVLADALGYERYNLYGVSYGTRIALTAARDAGDDVRSLVLDSAIPVQANFYSDEPALYEQTLTTLFEACAGDAGCRAFAPDLRGTLIDVIKELDDEPRTIEVEDYYTGELYESTVDGSYFLSVLFDAFYDATMVPYLPGAIVRTADGETDELSWLVSNSEAGGGGSSLGQYMSVLCYEERPFNSTRAIEGVRDSAFERLEENVRGDIAYLGSGCDAWGVEGAGERENEPVTSDIPALLLAGQFDPVTPPSYAHLAAETLANSTVLEFTGSAHGVLDEGCAMDTVAAFLDDPAGKPDTSCVDDLDAIDFEYP